MRSNKYVYQALWITGYHQGLFTYMVDQIIKTVDQFNAFGFFFGFFVGYNYSSMAKLQHGLDKPLFKLGHGWVITSYFLWIWLLICAKTQCCVTDMLLKEGPDLIVIDSVLIASSITMICLIWIKLVMIQLYIKCNSRKLLAASLKLREYANSKPLQNISIAQLYAFYLKNKGPWPILIHLAFRWLPSLKGY